jgi:TetR/AcrR family transcriptional regulator, transcriptional repressor for nem operon
VTKRSRQLTPKGQQTRQRILAAASRLVNERGVTQTTMEDVRVEAAVSSSQIYHYFADKQSLISAAFDGDLVGSGGQRAMAVNFVSLETLRAWGYGLVNQQRVSKYRNGCPLLTPPADVDGAGTGLVDSIARAVRQCEAEIRDGYRTMQEIGDLAADADPERLASQTLTTIIGGLVLAQLVGDAEPLAAAVDLVIAGVAADPYRLKNAEAQQFWIR